MFRSCSDFLPHGNKFSSARKIIFFRTKNNFLPHKNNFFFRTKNNFLPHENSRVCARPPKGVPIHLYFPAHWRVGLSSFLPRGGGAPTSYVGHCVAFSWLFFFRIQFEHKYNKCFQNVQGFGRKSDTEPPFRGDLRRRGYESVGRKARCAPPDGGCFSGLRESVSLSN